MARPRKTDTAETLEPTGTVQARRKAERARERAARAERQAIVEETVAAQKATAKRIANKPTDSRT
jgi:hypothetical protein